MLKYVYNLLMQNDRAVQDPLRPPANIQSSMYHELEEYTCEVVVHMIKEDIPDINYCYYFKLHVIVLDLHFLIF